jgi:superfamily I DNA/RNA helicase/CRISPR/Cas system-associated exonuclease Cas4 (RecB family)
MTLDPEKLPIVEAPIGATLKTIAGAGTGKTSVLVARYLRFVFEEGIAPDRLLALTFTTKAAAEMRTRIFEEAAKEGDIEVLRRLHSAWIMNFHQFTFRVIQENAAFFAIDPGVGVAAGLDLSRIHAYLFRRFQSGRIDGFPEEYGDDIPAPAALERQFDTWHKIVVKAKGTLLTPEGLLASVRPGEAEAYRRYVESVAALWRAYDDELERRNLIDFSDMIRVVVRGLAENARLRRRYVEKFDHILVDEFQDTSEAQNELVRLLSGGEFARVTVVGDDKQSIYRWRDARVRNLREFSGVEKFLRVNHRSTQGILDLAHHFVVTDPYFAARAEDIRLTADRGASDVPICVFHPADGSPKSFELEARSLSAWILSVTGRLGEKSPFAFYRASKTSLDFGDVAVLMRSQSEYSGLPGYEKAFREAGIPYAVSGGGGSLEARAFERLRDLVRLLVYPEDMRALIGVLENEPFSLSDASLKALFEDAGGHHVDAILSEENCGKLASAAAREACGRLRALLRDLRVRRLALDLPSFVSLALEEGPFYCHLFAEGADERLVEAVTETIVSVVDSLVVRGEENLAAFLEALDVAIEGKALGEGRGSTFPAGRVRVMTIHSAKGLQFPAVAVPGIKRGKSGSDGFYLSKDAGLFLSKKEDWGRGCTDSESYEEEKADGDQEELCLLYVAMTRARDHLFLSSPFASGVEKGEKENLFGAVLGVMRDNRILHEELREVSEIDVPARRGEGGRRDEERGRDEGCGRNEERGRDEERGKNEDREKLAAALLAEWSFERQRFDAARERRGAARGIEFATWRHLYTFAQCPSMYYYRYVTRIAPLAEGEAGVVTGEESEAFSSEPALPRGIDPKVYGSFVHRVLFEWMRSAAPTKARPEALVDDVAGRFGLSGPRMSGVRKGALETLGAFTGSELADRSAVFRLEEPAQIRVDRLLFRGTIDRIDLVDGAYRIIDYKGKSEREEYSYQVRFYAWLMRKAGFPAAEALLCYLARPISVDRVDISGEKLDGIERDALRLESAIAEGRFEPSPGGVCGECAFRGMCRYAKTAS